MPLDEHRFTLADFKLVDRIGRGGFGEVWRAECLSIHDMPSEVALKKIDPKVPLNKVLNECETQKKLEGHSNVVKLYGYFQDRNTFYIVLELCKYGDLRKYVKERGCLQAVCAAKILKQLVCALLHIHKNKIMHRDITPGNVLIYRKPDEKYPNDAPSVKITDFGLARELDRNTPAMTFAGTPGYMAQEMRNGDGYTAMGDLYSLGSLLYFMLTGREPSDREDFLDFTQNKYIPTSARNLIGRLRAPEKDRVTLNDVMRTDFMEEYVGVSKSGTSVERARRDLPTSARSSSSYRREPSTSVERPLRITGSSDVGQRRQHLEMNNADNVRPRAQSLSRDIDSGFRSNRTGSQHLSHFIPSENSVTNGFSLKWNLNPRRLLTSEAPTKVQLTEVFRAIITDRGEFILETFKNGAVEDILRIIPGSPQIVEIFRPHNLRIPRVKDPPVSVDEKSRRSYRSLAELQRNPADLQLYRNACKKLWVMGFDVPRVSGKHPHFPWGHCRLMENGDLRITGNSQNPNHEKLIRKTQNDSIVYKCISNSGVSKTLTDGTIISKMNEVYIMLIELEDIAIKNKLEFPISLNCFMTVDKFLVRSSHVTRSASVMSIPKASVASAPSTLYKVSQPLRPVENVRTHPESKYDYKKIQNSDDLFFITDKITGSTLRMSTNRDGRAIFRRDKNSKEERFLYDAGEENVPQDAIGLVQELRRLLKMKNFV